MPAPSARALLTTPQGLGTGAPLLRGASKHHCHGLLAFNLDLSDCVDLGSRTSPRCRLEPRATCCAWCTFCSLFPVLCLARCCFVSSCASVRPFGSVTWHNCLGWSTSLMHQSLAAEGWDIFSAASSAPYASRPTVESSTATWPTLPTFSLAKDVRV